MARNPGPTYMILDVLETAAAIIRTYGYISKTEAEKTGRQRTSTSIDIWMKSPSTAAPVIENADIVKAKEALAWLHAHDQKPASESSFDRSMRTLISGGYRNLAAGMVCKSDFGFIACVWETMDREANRVIKQEEAKQAASTSEFMGSLKKRADFFVKLVGLNYSDNVGCYIYKVKDRKGNIGVFFSSDGDLAKVDDCFLAKMTPKRHGVSDYHGGKETVFNRVKVLQNVGTTS